MNMEVMDFEPDYYIEQFKPHYTPENIHSLGSHAINCHHIFHTGHCWKKSNEARKLRNQPDFKPMMEVPVHDRIHIECPAVNVLSRDILRIVQAEFEPTGDTLRSLDKLLCIINSSLSNKNVRQSDRVKAQFSINALERQFYYLKGNIVNGKK